VPSGPLSPRTRTRTRAAVLAAALCVPATAEATEKEWHAGASFGFATIDFPRGSARYGFGGGLHARYGLNDAIDFTMNAALYGFPDDHRIAPSTSVGISYVVDVSRWFATVGLTGGVIDLIGVACDAGPFRCGNLFMPAAGLPITLEFRALPNLPIGVRAEYQLVFLGGPSQQLFVGAYAAFAK
jgi:hypothetical protein